MHKFEQDIMPLQRSTNRQHLVVGHIGDPESYAGVVRMEILASSNALAGSRLKASIKGIDLVETDLGAVSPGETVAVGLHFCLLPSGQHQAILSLEESDGGVSRLEISLNISHIGALAEETGRLLRQSGTPLFFVGPCDSRTYPYAAHVAWFDRPDADQYINGLLAANQVSELEAGHLRHFVQKGYMTIEGLIDDVLVDAVNGEIDDAIGKRYQGYELGTSQRIEHLHLHYPNVRKLWVDSRHRRYADLIFGATARPCQTLTYVFGSQQDAHQDTVHLTPFPAGYMCGTWIALQDVVPDSGELVVYPGSHRERRVYLAETGCEKVKGDWIEFGGKVNSIWSEMESRYQPVTYRPKKGTVLIWHENLLHAGSVRIDKTLQRRSIVIHCFADGAVAYYDSTGLAGSAVKREEVVGPALASLVS